ncbi:ABC transporter ATP-binding protein, partial [Rhodobacteraceae bacterium W635]|uniref:ABC transporter ATP-binding protein n=1 Tax=Nioella halotolerans TaxID=2303578 RepID=UPI000E8F062A
EIARLHKEIGATMIYVTHDQVEAMTLADKIVVLRDGSIEQAGRPLDLYNDPDNRFVAGFIGSPSMNFFPGTVGGGTAQVPGLGEVALSAPASASDGPVTVGVRPQMLRLAEGDTHRVDLSEQLGGVAYHYLIAGDGTRITVEAHDQTAPRPGSAVGLTVADDAALFFDGETGQRLR